jgi:hypothetical protein
MTPHKRLSLISVGTFGGAFRLGKWISKRVEISLRACSIKRSALSPEDDLNGETQRGAGLLRQNDLTVK